MMTVKHLERIWGKSGYDQLCREMLAGRIEASARLHAAVTGRVGAAAYALVRLDELGQRHPAIAASLVRALIASQDFRDGSWGDGSPLLTALAVRALRLSSGHGIAVERGLAALAAMQRDDAGWSATSLRRMPGDAWTTAAIVFFLTSDSPGAEIAVPNIDAALAWLQANASAFDSEGRRLWNRVSGRCRSAATRSANGASRARSREEKRSDLFADDRESLVTAAA